VTTIRITPAIAYELSDRMAGVAKYAPLEANDWRPGTYDLPEDLVDELQSWAAYEIGTADDNLQYGRDMAWLARRNAASALYRQTVAAIGRRHSIG
jgi:hypothetical protein